MSSMINTILVQALLMREQWLPDNDFVSKDGHKENSRDFFIYSECLLFLAYNFGVKPVFDALYSNLTKHSQLF